MAPPQMAAQQAGVIGFPLAHSISPQFQQPAFDHLGLDVSYRAYEVPPAELAAFMGKLRRGGWLGVNVTIPHKQAVFRLVDSVTDEARQIGAVNTVIVREGALVGDNTDAAGFLRALAEAGFDPAGTEAVMLGAGGAAKAVAVGLLRSGVRRLTIANRTVESAATLAQTLNAEFGAERAAALPLEADVVLRPLRESALLVNTTSVGMAHGPVPGVSPLPADLLGPHLVAYDLVYNPARTRLLADAEARGARTVEGLPMLVYQGAASFERWTGRTAPVEVMMAHGRRALAERERG